MQPAFLKEGVNEMEEPLADIFRKLVRTGGFTDGPKRGQCSTHTILFIISGSNDTGTMTVSYCMVLCWH